MRLVVSALLGTLVVVAMLLTALYFFDGKVDNASLRQGMEVTALPTNSRLDVAEWMEETRGDIPEENEDGDPVPRLPPPPPFELERPDISGFVQLVFTVSPDGQATDIRVFGAVPSGYYEAQAITAVRERRWDPDIDTDGRPVSRRATEVIRFTVPADTPRQLDRGDP
jgi:TonB family protein